MINIKNILIPVIFLGVSYSCSTPDYFRNELGLSKEQYRTIEKEKSVRDSILKYKQILSHERLKYRLDKYLKADYNKEKLFAAFQLEHLVGPNFEISDSIPSNSLRFSDADSTRAHMDYVWKSLANPIQRNLNIKVDTLK